MDWLDPVDSEEQHNGISCDFLSIRLDLGHILSASRQKYDIGGAFMAHGVFPETPVRLSPSSSNSGTR